MSLYPLFDCHAHLASLLDAGDFPGVLARMQLEHIERCAVICDPGDLEPDHEAALRLTANDPRLCLCVACHPQNALHYNAEVEATVRRVAKSARCIGETGLDYYDNRSTKAEQLYALNRQLDIACEMGLPVQLHIRNAHGDMIEVLRKRRDEHCLPKGLVHCFTRSRELAKVYLGFGYSISLAGPLTFTNANKLLETARSIPLERLLIETDSPWVSPEPKRTLPCEPAYLRYTFVRLCQLREEPPEVLAGALWQNACRFFGYEGEPV